MSDNDNDGDDDGDDDNTCGLDSVTAQTFALFKTAVPEDLREHGNVIVRDLIRLGYLLAMLACAKIRADARTTSTLELVHALLDKTESYSDGFDGFVELVTETLNEMSRP